MSTASRNQVSLEGRCRAVRVAIFEPAGCWTGDVRRRAGDQRRNDQPKSLIPNVGLEPTPSCEDRILSPVRLPYSWYWKHVAVILKGFDCEAVTILP